MDSRFVILLELVGGQKQNKCWNSRSSDGAGQWNGTLAAGQAGLPWWAGWAGGNRLWAPPEPVILIIFSSVRCKVVFACGVLQPLATGK